MITIQSIKPDIMDSQNRPSQQKKIENKDQSKVFKDMFKKKNDEKANGNSKIEDKNVGAAKDDNSEYTAETVKSNLNEATNKYNNVNNEFTEGTTGTKEKNDDEISNELSELLSLLNGLSIESNDKTNTNKLEVLLSSLLEQLRNTIVDKTSNESSGGNSKDAQLLDKLLKNEKEPKLTESLGLKLTAGKKEEVKEVTTILAQLITELKNGDLQENLKKNPQVLNELLNIAKESVTVQVNQLETMSFENLNSLKEMIKSVLNGARTVKGNKVSINMDTNDRNATTNNVTNYIKEDLLEDKLEVKIANNQNGKELNLIGTENKQSDNKDDAVLKKIIGDSEKKNENILIFTSRFNEVKNVEQVKVDLVINKNTVVNDVIKTVKYMTENDMKTLTVKMNPKDLGEITIKLIAQGDSMKVTINAASRDTVSLLNANETDIKKMLDAQGVKISEVNISLYNDDTTFFREQAGFGRQNENQRQEQSTKVINKESEDENASESLHNINNINMFA